MIIMKASNLLTLIRFRNTTVTVLYILLFSILLTRKVSLYEFSVVTLSNLFAIWAIYGFNDLEDAKLELGLKKRRKFFHKNLILNGRISEREAYGITLILGLLALLISLQMGIYNFLLIGLILLIGMIYSSSHFRFKSRPPFDVLSHAMIGPLISMGVFVTAGTSILYWIALLSFFLGSLIPEILNQRYDYYLDKKNKVKTTVQILGKAISLKLVIGLAFSIIALNGFIFFLYGGIDLALFYLLLSPLLIMFLNKRVRQLLEKKPIVLVIPILVNLIVLLIGFLNIL